MALNPQLFPNGMPVPFTNEMFVLVRDGVELEIDKIPRSRGGRVKAWGTIYLSNIRIVFVASQPVGNFFAFDMPLLYVHDEKFNQPIFHCNNISGQVEPGMSIGLSTPLIHSRFCSKKVAVEPLFHFS